MVRSRLLTVVVALVVVAAAAVVGAAPTSATVSVTGGVVSAGTFTVGGGGSLDPVTPGGHNTINLNPGRTILIFSGDFDLGPGEFLDFRFVGDDDTVLIKVPLGFTTIDGELNSYVGSTGQTPGGNVWFVDPHGVVVGSNADIGVGGFLGTTADIADEDFVDGRYHFSDAPVGSQVRVFGDVTGTGTVALVAPSVLQDANAVVTTGSKGEVLYGAASSFALGLGTVGADPGERLLSFTVPSGGASTVATPIDLNGSIIGGEVFVSAVSTSSPATTSIGATVRASGAVADQSGSVVIAAGGQLARATTGTMQVAPSPESDPHRLRLVDPLGSGLDIQALGGVRLAATDAVQLGVPVTARSGNVVIAADGDVALDSGARLSGASVELLIGGILSSTAPADAITTAAGGRWVVYADSPADVLSGPDSDNSAVWGVARGGALPAGATGNRYAFPQSKTLTFTAQDGSKTFGEVFTAYTATHDGDTVFQSARPGLFAADAPESVWSGTPGFSSDGAAADAKELAGGAAYPIVMDEGTLVSLTGYDFAFAPGGQLSVDDTTPPEVTPVLSGTRGADGWFTGDVALTWTVVDPGSETVTRVAGCEDVSIVEDQPSTAYGCTATSLGVGQTVVSVDIARDATAPVAAVTGTTAGGSHPYVSGAWTNRDVAVDFGCTDAGFSGVDPASVPADVVATASATYTGTCTDVAGNLSVPLAFDVKIDKFAPEVGAVTAVTASGPYVAGSWVDEDVTVSWTCTDEPGGSGVLTPDPVTVGTEASVLPVCTDRAGNVTEGDPFVVNVDKVDPVLAGVPTDITLHSMGGPVAATWTDPTATDAHLIGAATCDPRSGSSFPLAEDDPATTTTVTCSARDLAGNEATASFDVTVTRLAVTFDRPVDAVPVVNVAKIGRVVPVKATVTVGGAPFTGPSSVPLSIGVHPSGSCESTATDGIETYAAGSSNTGNLFRWDMTSGRWIYNLDTGASGMTAGGCYRIAVHYGGVVVDGRASGGSLAGYFHLSTRR